MQPELPPSPMPTPPASPTQPDMLAVPSVLPVPAPAAAPVPPSQAAPAMADDGDLIEKEWVHQVKRVVRATADDPYEQNRQFTKLKADYMQKRYGKAIKLDD